MTSKYTAPAGLVGVAPVEDHPDEAADVGDRRRRPRRRRHRQRVERLHVGLEARLLPRRQVEVVDAELAGLGEQRVVDVGDVAHARHGVAAVDQATLQHVVGEERRGVPEVGGVVRRDAARVHQHVAPRLERHDGLAGRVVQAHRGLGAPRRRSLGGERPAASRADAGQLRRDPGLVAHVELQQHRRERLDGGGVRQLTGVERSAAGDLGDDLADGGHGDAASSPQISTSESIGSPRCPSSLAGRWWSAATTWQPGTAACTWAATLPRGGTSGWNS